MNQIILPLTEIHPYPDNARDFSAALPALKESITRYGYTVPIVVDHAHVVIAGHARLQALKELGWTEATVIVSDMSPEHAREWRLVDNKSAEQATWDIERLRAELRSIEEKMEPFFDETELKSLLGGLEEIGQRTVTAAQVQSTSKAVLGKFRLKAAEHAADIRWEKCQHCGAEFGFDTVVTRNSL